MASEPDLGALPVEFHERLYRLLRVMSGATVAGVRPGKRLGSWIVELAFVDRVERVVIIYAPDQAAV